jgi:hypothetical protein
MPLCAAWIFSACGPTAPSTGDASGEASSSTSSGSDLGETGTGSSGGMSESSSETGSFVPNDGSDLPPDCDIFEQDCAEGHKCVPWIAPDASSWLGFTCVPVLGEQGVGEPCTHEFDDSSDDCDATSSCFAFSIFDGVAAGQCLAFCTGSFDDPMCAPDHVCLIGNGYLGPALCMPECDPIAQDCGGELGCYWFGSFFTCAASNGVGPGEACVYVDDCTPGHMCVDGEAVPGCDSPCCSPHCALSLGDGPCAAVPGTTCVPFFEQGMAPPGYEDLGICAAP